MGRIRSVYLLVPLILLTFVSLFLGLKDFPGRARLIIALSRLPRVLTIILAGMSMSIGGMIMQQIAKHRLVSPTADSADDGA